MITEILEFFSTSAIKDKITKGILSERQLFIYFYIIFIFDALNFTQQSLSVIGKQPSLVDLVNIWGYLIITAIGLVVLYFVNGGKQGFNFISKFFSLSFTVGFKYGIVFIILGTLPKFIPTLTMPGYSISIFIIVNSLIIINIAYQLYSIRHNNQPSRTGNFSYDS